MHLLKFGRLIFHKSPQRFLSVLEIIVKLFSSKIKISQKTSFVRVKCSSSKPFDAFAPKMPKYFPQCPKTVKKLENFCRKNSPIKNPLWTQRLQFLQTCRKIFAKNSKILGPKSKKNETIQRIRSPKTIFPKSPMDTWKQFWQPNQITFAKIPKCSAQSLQKTKKLEDFVTKKISSKISYGHKKCSFDHNIKKILTNSKHFPSKSSSKRKFCQRKW